MRTDVILERSADSGYWVYGEQVKTFVNGPFDKVFWYDSLEQAETYVTSDLGPRGQYHDRGDGNGPGARLVRRWVGPLELV